MLFWMRWKFAYYLAFILDVYDFKFIIFSRPTSTKTRSWDEIFIFSLPFIVDELPTRRHHHFPTPDAESCCREFCLLFCSRLLLLIRRSCQSTFPRRHIFLLLFSSSSRIALALHISIEPSPVEIIKEGRKEEEISISPKCLSLS